MPDVVFRILALIKKELLAMLKDRRTRTSLFLPPVLQSLLFGYAASYDLNHVPYAVVDQNRSEASRAFLARLDGSGVFERVVTLRSAADIQDCIDHRRALLVVQFDQNFERNLQAGRPARVQVIADGRNSNTANTAVAYVGAVADAFGAQWQEDHDQPGPPVTVTTRAWYNPALETRWNMIPALVGTLTMLQTLLLTAMSVAREREQGTFDQLLVTPYRPSEIMVGKAVPSMMVGTLQATLILVVAQLWFRIPFEGSFLTLYAGLGVFLLAAVGMGLMVSSFVATMQEAMFFSFVLIMPFTLLSGLTTPIANMPRALQYFTMINPLRYAIDMARRVYLEGAGLPQIVPDLWPLVIIGAITLPIAAWMFRHRLT